MPFIDVERMKGGAGCGKFDLLQMAIGWVGQVFVKKIQTEIQECIFPSYNAFTHF